MQELWFLPSARRLMLIDIWFWSWRADTILWQSQRKITQKVQMQELWFLHSHVV